MRNVDDRIERLIVRQLDGELTPAEQHELNRELLRSAAARRMLSDYQADDRLAGEVIEAAVSGTWSAQGPVRRSRGARRTWMWGGLLSGLAAAAIVLIVVGLPSTPGPSDPAGTRPQPVPVLSPVRPVSAADTLAYPGTDLANRGQRRVDRDYVGVYDEARGTLYMMELNRTRTVRIPVAGDL